MSTSLRDAIASEIRAELARQGMTQSQLAAAVGMSENYLWRRITPKLDKSFIVDELPPVAAALGIETRELLDRAYLAQNPTEFSYHTRGGETA